MEYKSLGNCGVKVSPLCLGAMMFGGQTNETDSIRIIQHAIDQGINFVDTANVYGKGESERVVGKAIADRRTSLILATKGRHPMGEGPNEQGASRVHLMYELDASLKRLATDYIDIYYTHTPDYNTSIEETLRTMDDMVRSGKVRYIACSNFRAWQLCEALGVSDKRNLNPFACVQPLYNIVNRDIEVELLPLCREKGIGVVSYSPLARGILTGKYKSGVQPAEGTRAARSDPRMMQAEWRAASLEVAEQILLHCEEKDVAPSQFAIAWAMANSIVTSVIIGPRTIEQFNDNLSCLEIDITAEDETFVDSLVPPGEHSGKGFQDTAYPVTGRGR